MDKEFIEKIQKRVVDLLLTLSDNLQVASKDQCSEITRLAGCWILLEQPGCGVRILKGKFSDRSAHDVLIIECNKELFLIDPTIWQIFPDNNSIFIGSVGNIQEALDLLGNKYGGSWKVAEDLYKCDNDSQDKLLATIKSNRK